MSTAAAAPQASATDPHAHQTLVHAGAPLAQAHALMLLLHGRGSTARNVMSLAREVNPPGAVRVAYLAPQAANDTWYPQRFIVPVAQNEPWLTSALQLLERTLRTAADAGMPAERTLIAGFSQGACLALEFVARAPRRLGGVAALSGALIENGDRPRAYQGSMLGTPVFLGCSDADAHIPLERVERSERLLAAMGAVVTKRIYPGMGHEINADELAVVRAMLQPLLE